MKIWTHSVPSGVAVEEQFKAPSSGGGGSGGGGGGGRGGRLDR